MKTIALIDSANYDTNSHEFQTISSHLVKQYKDLCSFLIYSTGDIKTDSDIICTNKNIVKCIVVPKIGYNLFVMLHALFYSDLIFIKDIHLSWFFPFFKLFFRKKIVLLYTHSNIPQKKSLFNFISLIREYLAIKYSDHVITNHEAVHDYLCANFSINVNFVENGGSDVERIESTVLDHIHYPFLKYMYAICYYNGESNSYFESVLDTFKQIKHKYLVVIGNWDLNEHSLGLKNRYAGYSNIHMLYPINSKRENDLILSNSILFIQPSPLIFDSKFLKESMSIKLPVLAFESINNKYLTEGKASYFNNTNEVKLFLENMSVEKLRKNANSMFDIAYLRFNWDRISKNYFEIINQDLEANDSISSKDKSINFKINRSAGQAIQPRLSFLRSIYNLFI
jgi:hypothetical protein